MGVGFERDKAVPYASELCFNYDVSLIATEQSLRCFLQWWLRYISVFSFDKALSIRMAGQFGGWHPPPAGSWSPPPAGQWDSYPVTAQPMPSYPYQTMPSTMSGATNNVVVEMGSMDYHSGLQALAYLPKIVMSKEIADECRGCGG